MKILWRALIVITLVPLLVCPGTSLRVREEEDGDVIYGTKARIPPSVRRRLKSRQNNRAQYGDFVSPPPTTNYVELHKTELRPVRKPDSEIYPITITPSPFASHPKSVRASSIQLKTPTNSGGEDYTPKPLVKIKTGRRRKVKRPPKIKPLVSNAVEEDVGSINNVNSKPSNVNSVTPEDAKNDTSGGDKNLAVEIGQEDGKYALIDKFFDAPLHQAPGVLSYSQSDDFAHDNKHTLGNLKENDIWLSDGHLLVLKGGDLDTSTKEHWRPIDDYERDPNRPPLKIPVDTNNPPPFPVFVNSSGPPIFLGPPPPFGLPYPPPGYEGNGTFDPSRLPPPGLIPLYPNGSIPPEFLGFPPTGGYGGGPQGGPGGNNNGSFPVFPPYPGPFPPNGQGNGSFPLLPPFGLPPSGGYGNGSLPPLPFIPFPPPGKNGSYPHILPPPPGFNLTGGPPGFPLLPPLALNPNDNETDDPSIFLPPPYDFDYDDGNHTLVPPGPFAPGLVVPPPKDFYTTYNKTKRFPSAPAGLPFGKRPQRPNGRKPKFPITPPPDDSLEALLPQTTPLPYNPVTITPHSKKRKRPGKANKNIFGSLPTLPKFDSSQEIAGLPPSSVPIPEQIVTANPPPPFVTTPTPRIVIKNSTPKPHNNYVYVRGQLKTLAEIAAEQDAAQHQDGGQYNNPTPRPPYDERGYPTRVLEENDPTIIDFPKKTTKAPAKTAYFNTPKYDNIYNVLPKRIKLKNRLNYNQPSPPSVPQTQSPAIYNHHNQHNIFPGVISDHSGHLHGQGGTGGEAYEQPNFHEKVTPIRPDYRYTNTGSVQPLQRQKPLVHLQSPKDYLQGQRQPHSYDQGSIPPQNNAGNGGAGGGTSTGFRPAFGPGHRQNSGNRIIFPGQVTSIGPIFNLQSPIFQQQKQNHRPQGYFSPLTQYHQPLHPNYNYHHHQPQLSGVQQPHQQPQSLHGQNQYIQQPQVYDEDEGHHQYQSQQQQPGNPSGPSAPPASQHYRNNYAQQIPPNSYTQLGAYNQPQSQAQGIHHQDALLSYSREPLPQYNTESEASVSSRGVLKAGPSQGTRQVGSSEPAPTQSAKDVSFFTFQRGGPGGFSYKIRI